MKVSDTTIEKKYKQWLCSADDDTDLIAELRSMSYEQIIDAFYRDLEFGTGGLRGIIGAGTNRINVYTVSRASQGLANYLGDGASIVIGYDTRIKSDLLARVAAGVFVDSGIKVYLWSDALPVPTVSYAIRALGADAGVMITASHNPTQYNGYKVYGSDGCQITTNAADEILREISKVDYFDQPININTNVEYIDARLLDDYIDQIKKQSVLYEDEIDRNVAIVYSPLNGTGLIPVTRALKEGGFTNITIVEEQRNPDGNFPTCPYPNPEIRDAMELGLEYCNRIGADLLLATDPDADRCGIAIKNSTGEYELLTGNEVGLLLLDFICSQRVKHHDMPEKPVFIKTIVTMDLAEKIAKHYGAETINVLTGFKFIGEVIGRLEKEGREKDYIFGFEESYGYLTGSYVRDKDAVNAAFMICEMFAFYKTRGISLIDKLNEIYRIYGYCLNTLHSFEFPGSSGMQKMQKIMNSLRDDLVEIGGQKIIRAEDYSIGLDGLPKSDVLKFYIECGSIVVRPSGTEPKLKVYISVTADDKTKAEIIEHDVNVAFAARMK